MPVYFYIYLFGSNKIKKNFPFKKTNVFFELLDIISLEDVNKLSTNEISDKVEIGRAHV